MMAILNTQMMRKRLNIKRKDAEKKGKLKIKKRRNQSRSKRNNRSNKELIHNLWINSNSIKCSCNLNCNFSNNNTKVFFSNNNNFIQCNIWGCPCKICHNFNKCSQFNTNSLINIISILIIKNNKNDNCI